MSRTEGVNLPRLPTLHARLTSPQSIKVHSAVVKPSGTAGAAGERTDQANKLGTKQHRRSVSEPSYTAYLGTPRQDIPHHVYHNAAMFDDVFEKQGKLFHSRDMPKITNPLNSLGYSSLHDPHCRKLFLNNKALRSHLMDLGLITDDLKVVASTHEQRQKIRAHELLERKETLLYKLEMQEKERIERLQKQPKQLPSRYRDSIQKSEERRERAEMVQKMKMDKMIQAQEVKKQLAEKKRLAEKRKMQQAIDEARLYEQAKRNAARYRQECAELAAYERQYGKFGCQLALWRRDSDKIHNRMVLMKRRNWSRLDNQEQLAKPHLYHDKSPETGSTTLAQVQLNPQPQAKVIDPVSGSKEPVHHDKAADKGPELPVDIAINPQTETADHEEATAGEPMAENANEKRAMIDDPLVENDAVTAQESEDEPEEGATEVAEEIKEQQQEEATMRLLDREQSDIQLINIFTDALQRLDNQGLGFVTVDDFTQLLNSRDLGLQLNENELLYIAEQADMGNGWVRFVPMAQHLPNLLAAMYNQRAELEVQRYGAYMEDQWCQMYLPSGVVYYNKLTGEILTGGRPDDFRPYLKEDPFEESIVDFFETADTDKDGIIDINNLYALLVSPMVSTRIYSNQMEDLLALFQENSESGLATLEVFAPIAKTLLVMIYQNAYPDVEEWIELDSRKFGTFLFNKETGEAYVTEEQTETTTERVSEPEAKSKKKKEKTKSSKPTAAPAPPIEEPKKQESDSQHAKERPENGTENQQPKNLLSQDDGDTKNQEGATVELEVEGNQSPAEPLHENNVTEEKSHTLEGMTTGDKLSSEERKNKSEVENIKDENEEESNDEKEGHNKDAQLALDNGSKIVPEDNSQVENELDTTQDKGENNSPAESKNTENKEVPSSTSESESHNEEPKSELDTTEKLSTQEHSDKTTIENTAVTAESST